MMNNNWLKDNLTYKQLDYLSLIASGLNTTEVAKIRIVSRHTVRNTIAKAKERVGAISTSNLVGMAITKGWIVEDKKGPPVSYKLP